jgi:FdhD protein
MEIRRLDPAARDISPAAFGRLLTAEGATPALWRVAEETPVAILLNCESFAVMMATPEDIEDFAVGFALTEGIVADPADILALRVADAGDGLAVNLRVAPGRAAAAADRRRRIPGRSACGLCGAATIEAALPRPRRVVPAPAPTHAALMAAFAALPGAQPMKRLNRSTHAAAFCRADGSIDALREDLGRHNALDKLAGALARGRRDAAGGFVLLSSRVSVEMVQKAAAIGAPWIAAASAPSALALRVAGQAGMGVAAACPGGAMLFDPGCLEAPR